MTTSTTETPLSKPRLLEDERARDLVRRYGTPLFVYDLGVVRERIQELSGFDRVRYAQKANSNLTLLREMRTLGTHIDSVSAGEIHRALLAGYAVEEIEFTADLFDRATLELLEIHDIHPNLGSADMVEQYAAVRPGGSVTLRLNPGFGHGHDLKVSTGGPHSKHGIWHAQLPEILTRIATAGLHVSGVHIHIGSGSDFEHLSRIRESLAQAALSVGDSLQTMSTGGGLPVPYRPGEKRFDLDRYVSDWQETKRDVVKELGHEISMEVEPGRYLVAECGILLAEVRATKRSGDIDYVLVDAGFDNLVRPALYGAYHHVSIVGRDDEPTAPRVVAGPLCESADMMTQTKGGIIDPRPLPAAHIGDLVAIHDAGAYAASMASNYNSRPKAAEVLVDGDRTELISRRQTIDELLAREIEPIEDC